MEVMKATEATTMEEVTFQLFHLQTLIKTEKKVALANLQNVKFQKLSEVVILSETCFHFLKVPQLW